MSDSKPTTAECIAWLKDKQRTESGDVYFDTIRVQLLAAQEMAKAWVKLNKRMKDAGSLKRACAFVDHPITIKAIADWKAVGGE